jgi:putative inorganic carbon (HCO3(-)) transporter
MTVGETAMQGPRRRAFSFRLRRSNDVLLAAAMGGILALMMQALPMQAALASSVVGSFVILALVDTRVAVFALLLARSVIDVTATVPLLSASGSSNVNAAAMMSFIAIGIGAAHIAISRIDITRVPTAKPTLLFLTITLLGVALAPDHNRAMQDWIRSVGTFSMFILIVDLMRSKADQRWVIKVLLLSAVVPVVWGIKQFIAGEGNVDTPGLVRIYGTFTHPSPYSFYLVELIPLAFVFLLYTRSKMGRLGLLVLIPAMLFCVYEAQTRGAWVGVVVGVMIFMSTRARWTLLLVPLMAGAMFFAIPSVHARFSEATSQQGSVVWRTEQWDAAIGVASTPKLLTVGAGLGAVDVTLGNLTHNEYVRLLVETGLAGLIATIFVYRSLFRIAMKEYREAASRYERDLMLAFLMVFAARVVIAASDNIIVYPALEWYFWAFAAVVVGSTGSYQRRRLGQRAPHDAAHPAAGTRAA